MTNFAHNFAGAGAIVADSITVTGRATAAGFTSTTEGSAAAPAYGFSTAAGFGLSVVASAKTIIAAGGASQLSAANGFVDTESGAVIRANARLELANPVSVALTSSPNDYAGPSGGNLSSLWRLTPDAARSITGIVARSAGTMLIIENCETTAGRNITLTNEDALSTAANRIVCPSATALVVPPGGAALLVYDSTTARWRAFPLY